MTHQEMWAAYKAVNPAAGEEYEAWAYGADPDTLAALTLAGTKTATASAGVWYERGEESMPRAGEHSVILDSHGQAVCVIRTARVYTVPFCEVTAEHAYREGEGDRSLAWWRRVHEDFFRAELEEAGLDFSPELPVVCEEFEVVWPKESALRCAGRGDPGAPPTGRYRDTAGRVVPPYRPALRSGAESCGSSPAGT